MCLLRFFNQTAIPNVYIHLAAAYAILRANGVDRGKTDLIGQFNAFDV
jgi:hypothetical protein